MYSSKNLEQIVCNNNPMLLLWQREAFQGFKESALNNEFPCVYIKPAYDDGFLLFDFIENPHDKSEVSRMSKVIVDYLNIVKSDANPLTAASRVLTVFVKPRDSWVNPSACEEDAWRFLQLLHENDPLPWPEICAKNPDDPSWAYCFNGTRLFINFSSPTHEIRRSRNLGPSLAIVIQPRDGIDYVAGPDSRGDSIRKFIRQRVHQYDGVTACGDLATNGKGENKDWKQFWLINDQEYRSGSCPLDIR